MGALPQVLALHGFSGAGADFDLLRAAHADLVWHTPDLPGHGSNLSTDPRDFRFGDIASTLIRTLRALPRPRILLGYSMGGRIALYTALQAPDELDGLVLIGASPGLADATDRATRRELDHQRSERVLQIGAAAFAEEWSRLPIIATRVGGIPELIQPLATKLVAPGDSQALAEAMRFWHGDAQARRLAGVAAREWVMAKHQPHDWAEKMIEIYRSAIAC